MQENINSVKNELIDGKYWVHWQMQPGDWQDFDRACKQTEANEAKLGLIGGIIIPPLFCIFLELPLIIMLAWIFFCVLGSFLSFPGEYNAEEVAVIKPIDIYIGAYEARIDRILYSYKDIEVQPSLYQLHPAAPKAIYIKKVTYVNNSFHYKNIYVPVPRSYEFEALQIINKLSQKKR